MEIGVEPMNLRNLWILVVVGFSIHGYYPNLDNFYNGLMWSLLRCIDISVVLYRALCQRDSIIFPFQMNSFLSSGAKVYVYNMISYH